MGGKVYWGWWGEGTHSVSEVTSCGGGVGAEGILGGAGGRWGPRGGQRPDDDGVVLGGGNGGRGSHVAAVNLSVPDGALREMCEAEPEVAVSERPTLVGSLAWLEMLSPDGACGYGSRVTVTLIIYSRDERNDS